MIKGINARKILLKSGRIIDPFSKKTFNGDLLIESGKISKISDSISTKGKDYKVKDGDVLNFRFNTWPNSLHTKIN